MGSSTPPTNTQNQRQHHQSTPTVRCSTSPLKQDAEPFLNHPYKKKKDEIVEKRRDEKPTDKTGDREQKEGTKRRKQFEELYARLDKMQVELTEANATIVQMSSFAASTKKSFLFFKRK